MKELLPTIIVLALAMVIFVWLWRRGAFLKVSGYVQDTKEELKKCTWPTWNELKGSTVVVMISIAILGGFTVTVDLLFNFVVRLLT